MNGTYVSLRGDGFLATEFDPYRETLLVDAGADDGWDAACQRAEDAALDEGAYRAAQSTFTRPLAGWDAADWEDAVLLHREGGHGYDSSDLPSRGA